MSGRLLITTAMEESWQYDQKVVFLGEWCKRYSRKKQWTSLDSIVIPYHWDNRAKLESDFNTLNILYEKILKELVVVLNDLHGVDYSVRYWRIIVGPWLGYFTQILYDRWSMIQIAASRKDIIGTITLVAKTEIFVPNGMADFSRAISQDYWNHNIYSNIIERFTDIKREIKATTNWVGMPSKSSKVKSRHILRNLARTYSTVVGLFANKADYFLINTYLKPADEIKLNYRLVGIPQLWRNYEPPSVKADLKKRQWSLTDFAGGGFEQCLRQMIPSHLPTLYLEGYSKMRRLASDLVWPKNPKLIWTSNAAIGDDVFKIWAADKVENGAKIVIGQHGGHYGIGRWSFVEDHERLISDLYLTWGWSVKGEKKVIPIGCFKTSRYKKNTKRGERALMVTVVHPRQSYFLYSAPVAGQWNQYLSDQFKFVSQLSQKIRSVLTVRLFPSDLGWDQETRWREKYPNIKIDNGQSNILKAIRTCRVYISTYNATTFLESMMMDIPTVIFWNPKYWELRDSVIEDFEELKRVGIFHATPEDAAFHINAIWDNVEDWWRSDRVAKAVKKFKHRYCHVANKIVMDLEALFVSNVKAL
jgi:putative transferase (TIGR04331 family)